MDELVFFLNEMECVKRKRQKLTHTFARLHPANFVKRSHQIVGSNPCFVLISALCESLRRQSRQRKNRPRRTRKRRKERSGLRVWYIGYPQGACALFRKQNWNNGSSWKERRGMNTHQNYEARPSWTTEDDNTECGQNLYLPKLYRLIRTPLDRPSLAYSVIFCSSSAFI